MRTTLNLDPSALELAKSAARIRKVSLGQIFSEALLQVYAPNSTKKVRVRVDESGFPTFSVGRPITYEEVKAFLEEED